MFALDVTSKFLDFAGRTKYLIKKLDQGWYSINGIRVLPSPESRLPHCMLCGQLKQGHMNVGRQKKCFKDNIKSILKSAIFFSIGWRLLHSTELSGNLPVPMERHILPLNTIVLQLADTGMPQCSANFQIALTGVQIVADNAGHALASTATIKSTFNDKKEDVLILNGWSQEE